MFKRFRKSGVYFSNTQEGQPPFRGSTLPLLKSNEIESSLETVYDTYHHTFNTQDTEQIHVKSGRTYRSVLEGAFSGWFTVLHRDHRWIDINGVPVMHVYIEWAEPYRELTPEAENKFKNRLDQPVE